MHSKRPRTVHAAFHCAFCYEKRLSDVVLVTAVSVWLSWVNVVHCAWALLQLPFAQRCVFLLLGAPQHKPCCWETSLKVVCVRAFLLRSV